MLTKAIRIIGVFCGVLSLLSLVLFIGFLILADTMQALKMLIYAATHAFACCTLINITDKDKRT